VKQNPAAGKQTKGFRRAKIFQIAQVKLQTSIVPELLLNFTGLLPRRFQPGARATHSAKESIAFRLVRWPRIWPRGPRIAGTIKIELAQNVFLNPRRFEEQYSKFGNLSIISSR
jgi:hypothetical protein